MTMAAISLSGCASPNQRKKQAAEALRKKYNEEFEIVSVREGGMLRDYWTAEAYSVEYPELVFKASIDNESGAIMDSYVTLRLCDRLAKQMSKNIGALENDYYIFVEAMLGDSVLTDPEVTLEDYLADAPGNRFVVNLCIEPIEDSAKAIASELFHLLDGIQGINGSMKIYLTDVELMEKVQEYVKSHDNTYHDFDEMTQEALIGSVPFENGTFSLTEIRLKEMAGDRL